MIDEKELKARMAGSLEAIKREIPALCESLGAREKDVAVATVSAFKTIEGIVDDLAEKGGWIPCSERLPEERGDYLVTTDYEGVDIATFEPDIAKWSYCDVDGYYWTYDIYTIAWMPLPEPYKERTEE